MILQNQFLSIGRGGIGQAHFLGAPRHPNHPNLVFNAPLASNLRDSISGTDATFNRAGSINVLQDDDTYDTFGVDTPGFGKYGLFSDGTGTNQFAADEYQDFSNWDTVEPTITKDQVGIEGVVNTASKINDTRDDELQRLYKSKIISDDSNTHTASLWLNKNDYSSRYPAFRLRYVGGTTALVEYFIFDIESLSISTEFNNDGDVSIYDPGGSFIRLDISMPNNNTGNTTAELRIYPAFSEDGAAGVTTATGYIIADWAQLEFDQAHASSPIPGGSSRATQAGDASDNGVSWPLASLSSRLTDCLSASGSMLVQLRPEGAINNAGHGIVSFGNSIAYQGSNDRISAYDGTNIIAITNILAVATWTLLAVTWGNSALKMYAKKGAGAWQTDTGVFDGAWALGTLRLFLSNQYPFWMKKLKFYDAALEQSAIETEIVK